MLSEKWQDRYYSFDRAWSTKSKQRMASMGNGSGDEWLIVVEPAGVFLKAFWHENPHEDVTKIYGGLPTKLLPQLKEPAFSMEDVTFGGWHDGTSWTLRGNAGEGAAPDPDRRSQEVPRTLPTTSRLIFRWTRSLTSSLVRSSTPRSSNESRPTQH